MSQEEETRSQRSIEPLSRLSSDDIESQVEVNTEDSDNYEWDNYRENPSFVLDPEEDLAEEHAEDTAVQEAGRLSLIHI